MKIAICIPVHGDTRATFTLALGRMLLRTAGDWNKVSPNAPLQLEIFMGAGALVSVSRERLVGLARNWGADWILWLDADQVFPPTTLLRLITRGKQAVGANYPRREEEARPTATHVDAEGNESLVWSTEDKVKAGMLEPVSYLGLGVCLVSMAAIDKAENPLFDAVREDVHFFGKLAAAGVTAFVDHGLSGEVGHIRLQVLDNTHSLAAKARSERSLSFPVGGDIEPPQ